MANANGPPTPPATTPVELQDEARANSSVSQPPESSPNPPSQPLVSTSLPEGYQNAIILIANAVSRNDFLDLVAISEKTDINVRYLHCFVSLSLIKHLQIPNDRQPSRLLIIAPLVLGHLILDDL